MKGDSNAMKELKERVIFGKFGIRNCLKRLKCTEAEINALEPQVVETVLNYLPSYEFNASFHVYGIRLAHNLSERYKENKKTKLFDKEKRKEKVLSDTPLTLNNSPAKPKHPPLEEIDLEIRTLVSLLNQPPFMKTSGASCSGHSDQDYWKMRKWSQYAGYIGINPIDSPRKTLDFLADMLMRLDNTDTHTKNPYLQNVLQNIHDIRKLNTHTTEAIRDRYKHTNAKNLYCSGAPIVLIGVSFRFYVCHSNAKHALKIWQQLIMCINELIPEKEKITTEVDTPEMAMQTLQIALNKLPYLFSVTLVDSREGHPGIILNTVANLAVFQWFSVLGDKLDEYLDKAGFISSPDASSKVPFVIKWYFKLKPFLNQELIPLPHLLSPQWEPRTREDHLKIWKLLELTVAEQVNQFKQ